jgi:uncharacterized protein (DUF433 family)
MYQYITFDPKILGGKSLIRGTRLCVEFIMELFASGASKADILRSYPHLHPESIDEVLRYAADAVKNEVLLITQISP